MEEVKTHRSLSQLIFITPTLNGGRVPKLEDCVADMKEKAQDNKETRVSDTSHNQVVLIVEENVPKN